MIFAGKKLEDEKVLYDYNVQKDSTFLMIVRPNSSPLTVSGNNIGYRLLYECVKEYF